MTRASPELIADIESERRDHHYLSASRYYASLHLNHCSRWYTWRDRRNAYPVTWILLRRNRRRTSSCYRHLLTSRRRARRSF